MRTVAIRLFLGVALAGVAALAWPRSPVVALDDPPARSARTDLAYMGVATCSSMSCHHKNEGRGKKGSEYSTWAGYDQHAQAFAVLYNERSKRMVRNLYGDKAEATEEKLCLKCHAMTDPKTARVGERYYQADGVGCESCHGPAEKWLAVHYEEGFKDKNPTEKERLGLRDLTNLVGRARLCAECHVGNANKEVNHDLIAAGHPRLNFEFGAFHGIYPKHWDTQDDRKRYPDFEARAWVVGQIESARTALALLQTRAESAAKGGKEARPWPEFSEYTCFACHKDLQVENPSQKAKFAGRYPGSMPWGDWYFSMPQLYARHSEFNMNQPGGSLEQLRILMQKPGSDASAVAKEAAALVKALDGWEKRVAKAPMTVSDIRGLMQAFAEDGVRRADSLDWDQTAQLYLALAALTQARSDLTGIQPGQLKEDLRAVRNKLKAAFKPGYDSPQGFDPRKEPRLDRQFQAIREQLGN
jgi:hypothetical protein